MTKTPYIAGVNIDYGHGEDTPGKRYKFTDHGGLECREYMTNRMTAARLIKLLVEADIPVFDVVANRTWEKSDVRAADWCWHKLEQSDVPLATRVARANRRTRYLVLSIHSNAVGYKNVGPSLDARGACFYTSRGQTGSDIIADAMHDAFTTAFLREPVYVRRGEMDDGDHDYEANFYMLKKTVGYAVLGEVLFFVNIDDARYLLSDHGQDVIARAYFDAVESFFAT